MVREVSFAGDDVGQTVAVHVRDRNGMELREAQGIRIHIRFVGKNLVLGPGYLSLTIFLLLIPSEPIAMCGGAGDHVVEPIAVDIKGVHLRAADAELGRMILPLRLTLQGLGLLPPPFGFEDVISAIAIDIAPSESMREALPSSLGRDGHK